MDEFDLPIDQVRSILETQAGKDALWASRRKTTFTVRCPDRGHALARMHDIAGVSVLSIGPVLHASKFAAQIIDTHLQARAFERPESGQILDASGLEADADLARCRCMSWALPRALIFAVLDGASDELRSTPGRYPPETVSIARRFRAYSGSDLSTARAQTRDMLEHLDRLVAKDKYKYSTDPDVLSLAQDLRRRLELVEKATSLPHMTRDEFESTYKSVDAGRGVSEALVHRAEDIAARYADPGDSDGPRRH